MNYTFDPNLIDVKETQNQDDVTFIFEVKAEAMRQRLKQVRHFFDENKDYTDALFYSRNDGNYEVIVRNDMLVTFLLQAFRFRCIESLSWK